MTAPLPGMAPVRVVVHPGTDALAETTAARLLVTLTDVLTVQAAAHVVLTGGTVGIATLAAVARSPLATSVDWTAVHLWWGDERFVPSGDEDRNEGQAQSAALGLLPVPEENIHRMGAAQAVGDGSLDAGGPVAGGQTAPGLYPTVELAAQAYEAQIAAAGTPAWDIALFGMGPDGHVASLFPGHAGFVEDGEGEQVIAVHDSPKPPPTRVSLTMESIRRARRVWIVAAGAPKAAVVAAALHGDQTLPATRARGTAETLWLIDVEAAAHM